MILIWIQGCGYSNAGTELHDITTHIIKIALALFFNAYFPSKNIIFQLCQAVEPRVSGLYDKTRKTENLCNTEPTLVGRWAHGLKWSKLTFNLTNQLDWAALASQNCFPLWLGRGRIWISEDNINNDWVNCRICLDPQIRSGSLCLCLYLCVT